MVKEAGRGLSGSRGPLGVKIAGAVLLYRSTDVRVHTL